MLATFSEDCIVSLPTGETWNGMDGARAFYEWFLTVFDKMVWSPNAVVIGPQGVIDIADMRATQRKNQFQVVLIVGDLCNHNSPAVDWTMFSVNVPSYGSGCLAMVQVGQTTVSGILNGKQTATVSSLSRLDWEFPYAGAYATTDSDRDAGWIAYY